MANSAGARQSHWSCGLCMAAALLAWGMGTASAAETVLYPRAENVKDSRNEYNIQLLQLALQKAGTAYQLKFTTLYMHQSRALLELARTSGKVDVVGTTTSREREAQLLPVRIPLSKGLIGWRLMLLPKSHAERFRDVKSVNDIKAFLAGQGHDWTDIDILKSNGLKVCGISGYYNIFDMLNAGRIDYFPRAVGEIWDEAAADARTVIDPYILIRYPAPDYFFVSKNNSKLAEEIRRGLELALADGSFDRLFYKYFGPAIRQAKIDKRLIIDMDNPHLSAETPLGRKELWFQPGDSKNLRPPLP